MAYYGVSSVLMRFELVLRLGLFVVVSFGGLSYFTNGNIITLKQKGMFLMRWRMFICEKDLTILKVMLEQGYGS